MKTELPNWKPTANPLEVSIKELPRDAVGEAFIQTGHCSLLVTCLGMSHSHGSVNSCLKKLVGYIVN